MPLRRVWSTAFAITLALQSVSIVHAAPVPFPDMEHRWYRYREAVAYLAERDVIQGYPDGTFRPKQTINRAELLKIVFKGKSDVEPIKRRCFSDVSPRAWYAPFVCAAKQRGIVKGYPDGTFKPEEPVNFAEAIKIVLNAYNQEVEEGTGAEWYLPYVEKLEEMEIMNQRSYIPWAALTRERAADLLWRMLRHDEERFVPRLSSGCGKADVEGKTTVMVKGVERSFLLTIPDHYVRNDPAPLIVAFHGRTNSNEQVRQYLRLDREIRDAIIAYPASIKRDNGTYSWSDPGDKPDQLRDIAFFDAIVEELAETYCIDMDRIAVVGHSLGAWMANSVACVRGGVVFASATVGGDSVFTDCAGPSSAMIVHHPKDTLSPFSGAERVRAMRITANACLWETVDTGPRELNCVTHRRCAGGNIVLWCPHTLDSDDRGQYNPHHWPRITAGLISAFFAQLR